ncbi:MAG: DUF445 domain-containing protein, partial [Clostridia bacterium]
SVIGGVTNELAIRMLFRPYKEWKIGGVRVPFTPGLIPRRKDEIGVQMGRLVKEHLLTPEGIHRALEKSDLEGTLRNWLTGVADEQLGREQTLREWLATNAPTLVALDGSLGESVKAPLQQAWRSLTDRWMMQSRDKQLRAFLPQSGADKLQDGIEKLSRSIVQRLAEYLHSEEGRESISGLLRGFFSGGGGMLGGLVGMFLNEEKLLGMIMPHLDELLRREELPRRLAALMQKEADRLLDKPLAEVLEWIGEEKVNHWRERLFERLLAEGTKLLDKRICDLTAALREPVREQWVPRLSAWATDSLRRNVERIFDKLPIAEIVARQVEGFPLQRVEEMIIGISGSEFRMITILGFVLGGMIGLVQGLLNFLW